MKSDRNIYYHASFPPNYVPRCAAFHRNMVVTLSTILVRGYHNCGDETPSGHVYIRIVVFGMHHLITADYATQVLLAVHQQCMFSFLCGSER